jgi:rubrerythrin
MSKLRIPLPKKTERVHKDKTKYKRSSEKDANDIRQEQSGTQTICCGHCGHEYDRHVGDQCPNCGHVSKLWA